MTVNYSKKQIKPLIDKYQIDVENNKVFQTIICMFEEQTNYQIWALKAVFGGVIGIEAIQSIKAWAENNHNEIQNLTKKNIVSYKSKEDFKLLFNEMEGLVKIRFVKDSISKFNTQQREMMKKHVFENINSGSEAKFSKRFNMWHDAFKKMLTLPKHRQEKLISTSSAVSDVKFLFEHIKNALEASYSWNKEELLGFVARNCSECKVVFESDNIVVLTVPNFECSKKLCGGGRTGWCLTREDNYFRRYVLEPKDAVQYFLFDFSRREDHELAHVGFTVQASNGITNAHSTRNNCLTGDGYTIDGTRLNIQKILELDGVPKNVFIRLKDLKNYTWGVEEFLNWVEKHESDVAICYGEDKRVIVNPLTSRGLDMVLSHTLIRYRDFQVNSKCKHYILLDFNKDVNDEKAIVSLYFTKDQYETDSLHRMFDAYGTNIMSDNYLAKIGIGFDKFLDREEIAPKILLHKLIDEKDEEAAIKLLTENTDLEVNYVFNNRTPIFSVIDNKLFGIFKALINHKNFDSSIQNSYGEALLQSLLYDYNSDGNSERDNNNIKKMINIVIESDNFDLNALNLNDDPAINVAAEKPYLLWVVEKLSSNPRVNVNIINDYNCSPFTNALRKKNFDAAKILGKRPDLIVREEDKTLAKELGVDLKDFIHPTPFATESVEKIVNEPKISSFDFATLFEHALSMSKA